MADSESTYDHPWSLIFLRLCESPQLYAAEFASFGIHVQAPPAARGSHCHTHRGARVQRSALVQTAAAAPRGRSPRAARIGRSSRVAQRRRKSRSVPTAVSGPGRLPAVEQLTTAVGDAPRRALVTPDKAAPCWRVGRPITPADSTARATHRQCTSSRAAPTELRHAIALETSNCCRRPKHRHSRPRSAGQRRAPAAWRAAKCSGCGRPRMKVALSGKLSHSDVAAAGATAVRPGGDLAGLRSGIRG